MADATAEQLKRLKAKGQAMANASGDPSFPIKQRTGSDSLANAIRAVGRARPNTPAQRAKVRRYIIRVARQKGWSDDIPSSWQSDGSLSGGGS